MDTTNDTAICAGARKRVQACGAAGGSNEATATGGRGLAVSVQDLLAVSGRMAQMLEISAAGNQIPCAGR